MSGVGILARSEIRVMIDNAYLDKYANKAGSGADIDVTNLKPAEAFATTLKLPKSGILNTFEGRFISLNGALSSDQQGNEEIDFDATYGFVNGREKNDPGTMRERFNCGILHSNGFRFIRPNGTTGRGIIIHG